MNGHDYVTLVDFVKLRVKEWLRYANLSFNFNSSIKSSDVRISFQDPGSNCEVGSDSHAPALENKTTMVLKLNCDKVTVLHGRLEKESGRLPC